MKIKFDLFNSSNHDISIFEELPDKAVKIVKGLWVSSTTHWVDTEIYSFGHLKKLDAFIYDAVKIARNDVLIELIK